MPALASQLFTDITPEKWKGIQTAASVYGINIEEDTGRTETYGADIQWVRNPLRQTVEIAIWKSTLLSTNQLLSMLGRMVENA